MVHRKAVGRWNRAEGTEARVRGRAVSTGTVVSQSGTAVSRRDAEKGIQDMKAAAKIVCAVLRLAVVFPIFYYLAYTVLSAIHGDRLVWFLFWIYVPADLIATIISVTLTTAAEKAEKK
jgi:hypothetical protein